MNSTTHSELLNVALRLNDWGANVVLLEHNERSPKGTTVGRWQLHDDDGNPLTKPDGNGGTKRRTTREWEQWQETKQTADDVQRLFGVAKQPVGLLVVNGVGGWRSVDFDAHKDNNQRAVGEGVPFDVVRRLCNALDVDPETYPWIVRSGNGGWHVWFVCNDADVPEPLNAPDVSLTNLRPVAEYVDAFDHAELRWSFNLTIVPPTTLANGNTYGFRNGNNLCTPTGAVVVATPTTPPVVVTGVQLANALLSVVQGPDLGTIRATVARMDTPNTPLNSTTYWQYDDDPDHDVEWQRAKDDARARFDLVAYIQRHINDTHVERQPNGELRVGKPGAGHGGWHVTADGQNWNNFLNGNERGKTIGGDCFALVAYCEFGQYRMSNLSKDQRRVVWETVSRQSGVTFPVPQRKRRYIHSDGQPMTDNATTDGQQHAPQTNRRGKGGRKTNAELVLDFLQRFRLRRNQLTHIIEWQPVGADAETWHVMNDDHVAEWRTTLELETGTRVGKDAFEDYLRTTLHKFDPLHDYFDGLPKWDGHTDHIRELLRVVDAEEPELFVDHLTKWLIGTYATGYYGATTGATVNELFFVLHGPQGLGKTTFIKMLVPKVLQPYLHVGKFGDDKDDQMLQVQSFILINDELRGLKDKDVEHVKMVMSKTDYRFRAPYDRHPQTHKRRVSFCGCTNDDTFLTDHTGNRRFLIHSVRALDFDSYLSVDVDNLWAQVRALHESGVRHWLTREEIDAHAIHMRRYAVESYTDGLLVRYFIPGTATTPCAEFVTTTELAQRIANIYDAEHTTTDNRGLSGDVTVRDGTPRPNPERILWQLGRSLYKFGFERVKLRRGVTSVWGYWVVRHDPNQAKPNPADDVKNDTTTTRGISEPGGVDDVPF